MGRVVRVALGVASAALLASACASPPKDNGSILTLPPTSVVATTTTTQPPILMNATIHVRLTGLPKASSETLDRENTCSDNRAGTLSVHGVGADGAKLDVAVLHPAAGTYPVAPSPAGPGVHVTNFVFHYSGKDYHPSGGGVTLSDVQAHKANLNVDSFAESAPFHLSADWLCSAPISTTTTAAAPH